MTLGPPKLLKNPPQKIGTFDSDFRYATQKILLLKFLVDFEMRLHQKILYVNFRFHVCYFSFC